MTGHRFTTSVRALALLCCAAVLVAIAGPATHAHADGGLVRARDAHGALTVTLFTSPTPLRVGAADVSVLVQDGRSGAAVLDADVVLSVTPLDAPGATTQVPLSGQAATNKLLYAATIGLPAAGRCRLSAAVRHGSERSVTTVEVDVAPPLPALLALWPYLALPPVVVGLFLVHQWLGRRSGRRASALLVAAAPTGAAR